MSGIRGIAQKSLRSEAIELNRTLRWSSQRIAEVLEVDVEQVQEWIFGKRKPTRTGGRGISEASPEQREKVKSKACIRCRKPGPCHPAHLIDRSLCSLGADDALAVVPLCPTCHREYDEEDVSILEHLEPNYREELAFAVERVGLLTTLFRVSGETWAPVDRKVAA